MCSCQSSLSINNPLDYANDLALISLFPTLPGPLPPFAWPTSLKVFSLFFVCAQSLSGFPPLTDLFFLSLLLRNLRATGKTLDSSLHPYQEPRPKRVCPLQTSLYLLTYLLTYQGFFHFYWTVIFHCLLLSFKHNHRRRQWHTTSVLLPGKSHGPRSLVGCSPWGHQESDTY